MKSPRLIILALLVSLVALVAFAAVVCGAPAPTTAPTTGDAWGTVYDSQGGKLTRPASTPAGIIGMAGVTVTLDTGATSTTNRYGTYQFHAVPAGPHTLTIAPPSGYLYIGLGANNATAITITAGKFVHSTDLPLTIALPIHVTPAPATAPVTQPGPPPIVVPPTSQPTSQPTTQPIDPYAEPPLVALPVPVGVVPIVVTADTDPATLVSQGKPGTYYLYPSGASIHSVGGADQPTTSWGVTIDLNGGTCQLTGDGTAFTSKGAIFTLRNGRVLGNATLTDAAGNYSPRGSLASLWGQFATLENCHVDYLDSGIKNNQWGATGLRVRGCWFGPHMGGICVYACESDAEITSNVFGGSMGEYNARVDLDNQGHRPRGILIAGNLFRDHCPQRKEALGIREGFNVAVIGNTFDGFFRAGQGSATAPGDHSSGVMRGNTFTWLRGPDGATVDLQEGSDWIVDGNTFTVDDKQPCIALGATSVVLATRNVQLLIAPGIVPKPLIGGGRGTEYGTIVLSPLTTLNALKP